MFSQRVGHLVNARGLEIFHNKIFLWNHTHFLSDQEVATADIAWMCLKGAEKEMS